MKESLIKELSANDMKAVMDAYDYGNYYYPSIFPFMFTPLLTWKALSTDLGMNIAADVVSFNSATKKKTRTVTERLTGDIPKIEILRVKEESDLNDYRQLQHYYTTTTGQEALMNWIYNDIEFCWKGVNSRLEWLAMRALSTGKFVLNSDNNAGTVIETTVDFGVPTDQKKKAAVAWSKNDTATPITDIRGIVAAGVAKGTLLKYIYMNQDTYYEMMACQEVVDFCSYWTPASGRIGVPTLDEMNYAMKAHRLPEIRIIDSYVTIEKADGTRTTVNPWEQDSITFVPELECGYTFHAPLADEMVNESVATKVKRDHILIKKYSTEDPVSEITKGIANAIPVWSNADKCFLLDTSAATED